MLFLFSVTWGAASGWWVLACIALGIIYAWLLYRQPVTLTPLWRYLLSIFRFLTVTIIALLLLSPLIKTVSTRPEKPLILIAQDNSASITFFKAQGFDARQFVSRLANIKKVLGNDYDVREFNFSDQLSGSLSNTFNGKKTDISAAFRGMADRFSNQNIGALVLATDGIYNQGSSPQGLAGGLKTSIYTVALGDTVPKRDLLIANVNYNKTAFLGNDFEIEVLAEAYQAKGENLKLNVSEDGHPVANQNFAISSGDFHKTIPLKLTADKKGIHQFTVSLQSVNNEISTANNTETIYVEVLDTRQKILVLYNGPHPDIAAIRQSLESNKNYEVKTSLLADFKPAQLNGYSTVILYQLPAPGNNASLFNAIAQLKIPVFYMAGAQSDLPQLNLAEKVVSIVASRPSVQEVFASPVTNFSLFTLSDSTRLTLNKLPPLSAPYGTYSNLNAASTALKQRIGNVETSYPLLAFGEDAGRRIAVLAGEGLWRWRLSEYQLNGNHHALDELLGQSVQYLTAKDDKRRFRVYPGKNAFDEGEDVILNAELYNDALELVNTPEVKVDLKSKAGKAYSFIFSRSNQGYQLNAGALPPDEYTYSAVTKLADKNLSVTGRFAVRALNAETRQSTADHHLLNTLAKQNGGVMLMPAEVERLPDLIRKNENIKTIVYSDNHYQELVDEKWIFGLVLALLSTEWFLRKREGAL